MGALDLVITVDTAIAHLAGALAKKSGCCSAMCRLALGPQRNGQSMVSQDADLQQVAGFEWRSVIEEVSKALRDRVPEGCDLR
jgi:hypothetical protein